MASGGGIGVADINGPHLFLRNCIAWGNRSETSTGPQTTESAQIYVSGGAHSLVSVLYSDIQGISAFAHATNISADPKFLDGTYRLAACSSAIDRGNSPIVPADDLDVDQDLDELEATPDLDQLDRVTDSAQVQDTGVPDTSGFVVDLGAYEFRSLCDGDLGDLNGNGFLDAEPGDPISDAALIRNCYTANTNEPPGYGCYCADMDQNGLIQQADLICFSLQFGGAPPCNLSTCEAPLVLPFMDCDENGEIDLFDVLDGVVPDCNGNLIPDSCDMHPKDPDNNGQVSTDLNGNGIPDDCDPDCQPNGIPDDFEIQMRLTRDNNSNGIPDDCEQ